MSLVVQKFGGTSVADSHHIAVVARKAAAFYEKGHDVIVVVSAQGDMTDRLAEKAREIDPFAKGRELDSLLSVGEQISASLLCMAIKKLGIPAVSLTGWQAGFRTVGSHNNSKVESIDTSRIKKELAEKKIVVITGFQGVNENGDITTLGRGGSDTTAVAIAGAMNADVCKIYTDVDGVYTADPRVVSSARKLDTISYEEMFELSSLGAQVLNDVSIQTARKCSVEVEVLSSMKKDSKGTMMKQIPKNQVGCASGIATEKNMVKFIISNLENPEETKKDLFPTLCEKGFLKDPGLVATGQSFAGDVVFLTCEECIHDVTEFLSGYLTAFDGAEVFYEKNKSKISVVNLSDSLNVNIASIVFETLNEANVSIEMAACDDKRISVVIDSENLYKAVNAVHNKLFEEDYLV